MLLGCNVKYSLLLLKLVLNLTLGIIFNWVLSSKYEFTFCILVFWRTSFVSSFRTVGTQSVSNESCDFYVGCVL